MSLETKKGSNFRLKMQSAENLDSIGANFINLHKSVNYGHWVDSANIFLMSTLTKLVVEFVWVIIYYFAREAISLSICRHGAKLIWVGSQQQGVEENKEPEV